MATGTSLSSYTEAALLNWIKGTAFPGAPANLYVALFTTAPTDAAASGVEVSGNAYARVAIASSGWSAITDNGAGSGAVISNSGAVNFATPTPAGWGTVVAFALFDALTNGNMVFWATITSKVINAGDTVTFAIGAITVTVD